MAQEVLEKIKATSIYPDHLMSGVSKSIITKALIFSVVAHVLVIGLTSIGFVRLCLKYKSLHPKILMKAEEDQAREAELEKARQEKFEAGAKAAQAAKPAEGAAAAPAADGATPPADGTAPAAGGAEAPKTPIEKAIEEVSHEKPEAPAANFDDVDNLAP